MKPKILLCPGYQTTLSPKQQELFKDFDLHVYHVLQSSGFESMLDMATVIFDELLKLDWTEFYLMGWDLTGMAVMQLLLLLNGRDDLNCLGCFVVGCSVGKPRGKLLKMIEKDEKLVDCVAMFDLSDQLHLMRSPVVWVHGLKDDLIHVIESNACNSIANAKLHTIDSGHFVLDEKPEQLIQILKSHTSE